MKNQTKIENQNYFFSQDHEYGRFLTEANFTKISAETEEQAIYAYLREVGNKVAVLPNEYDRHDFGDCWLKLSGYSSLTTAQLTKEAEDNPRLIAPFAPDQMSIENAGTHPGGKEVWLTPNANTIAIMVYADLEEFADSVACYREGEKLTVYSLK